ncbi:MAG: hypothetical protein HQK84_05080 [Nitrospinae bacterium]|nr:hypothetical protein [Nitrospinota bacterium]
MNFEEIKEKFFTKKNIIIGGGAIAVIFVGITLFFLLSGNDPKEVQNEKKGESKETKIETDKKKSDSNDDSESLGEIDEKKNAGKEKTEEKEDPFQVTGIASLEDNDGTEYKPPKQKKPYYQTYYSQQLYMMEEKVFKNYYGEGKKIIDISFALKIEADLGFTSNSLEKGKSAGIYMVGEKLKDETFFMRHLIVVKDGNHKTLQKIPVDFGSYDRKISPVEGIDTLFAWIADKENEMKNKFIFFSDDFKGIQENIETKEKVSVSFMRSNPLYRFRESIGIMGPDFISEIVRIEKGKYLLITGIISIVDAAHGGGTHFEEVNRTMLEGDNFNDIKYESKNKFFEFTREFLRTFEKKSTE